MLKGCKRLPNGSLHVDFLISSTDCRTESCTFDAPRPIFMTRERQELSQRYSMILIVFRSSNFMSCHTDGHAWPIRSMVRPGLESITTKEPFVSRVPPIPDVDVYIAPESCRLIGTTKTLFARTRFFHIISSYLHDMYMV
jgi:hypothetical protein